ncbi:methyltransferase domain-containing protein [Permianibacter sp. IMCC34836]|uniref:methyltransferase domain-containing protein n=1 Tax=Permianibacter fluminis TaxID=2738515 RepID=UPI0015533FA5|nr:methyltransferase domain-containing protein [Permianibacter fluminis]NQD38742.1 methyltransferase domain-containing protein [Permianibacter fluminis]
MNASSTDLNATADCPWQQLPAGAELKRALEAELAEHLQCAFGYHLLSLGRYASTLDLAACPVRHHWALERDRGHLLAQPEALPLQTDSIDVALLPLTLEFSPDPHALLREVQRVLIGDGHLLIAGFNPWSLWGARRLLSGRPLPAKHAPWQARFLSAGRVSDWLQLLGFEINATCHHHYLPPLRSEAWQRRWRFMDRIGQRAWTNAGAMYVIAAQKRVLPLTPIRLAKRRLMALPVAGVVTPSPHREPALRVVRK